MNNNESSHEAQAPGFDTLRLILDGHGAAWASGHEGNMSYHADGVRASDDAEEESDEDEDDEFDEDDGEEVDDDEEDDGEDEEESD